MVLTITVQILVTAMVIISLSGLPYQFFDSSSAADASSTIKYSLSELIQMGSPYVGNTSAPITIIDFSDFQCHLCARYVKNTEPLINETYVQTGQVTLVFKHLPNRGFDSMGAHLAAQCTNDQETQSEIAERVGVDQSTVSRDLQEANRRQRRR